jgi:hypothetical protein
MNFAAPLKFYETNVCSTYRHVELADMDKQLEHELTQAILRACICYLKLSGLQTNSDDGLNNGRRNFASALRSVAARIDVRPDVTMH